MLEVYLNYFVLHFGGVALFWVLLALARAYVESL